LKDAGIENLRFHDLRHTAGTRLAEAGADAFTIKDILGHASIQTSAIYIHATDEENAVPSPRSVDTRKILVKNWSKMKKSRFDCLI
jgi:integrase